MSAVRPLLILAFACGALLGAADLPLVHPLFTDHMVFPRDREAPVWGWTEPGKEVTVAMAGKSAKAVADAGGRWQLKLGPIPAGGPHELVVTGPTARTIGDVLVGDVWLCGGQSNMEWQMHSVNRSAEEIAAASQPGIRLFAVPKRISLQVEPLVKASWQVCTPQSVAGFSAVGYFFGRQIHQEVGVPVGLIGCNFGGTMAEAWTSAAALRTMPDFKGPVDDFEALVKKVGQDDFEQVMGEWWRKNDPGSANGLGFADPMVDVGGWKTMTLPGMWESSGLPDYDGVVWYRRDFDLPEAWAGKDLSLLLGPIDDRDTTWVNGSKVGEMISPNHHRTYKVPKKLLKAGRNTIAIRVLDTGGGGGLHGGKDHPRLEGGDGPPLILAGEWRYNASRSLRETSPPPQRIDDNPNAVAVLSNGMLSGVEPYAIRGAIWYQGESNTDRPEQYRRLLPTMIRDWRARFGSELPFYIVQLANHMDPTGEPVQSGWAETREAQLYTAQTVPNCGLAVTIDIGDARDIHPRNKQDVGKRLALEALAKTYGRQLVHQGPLYKGMQVEGASIRLQFDHVGGGLVGKDATDGRLPSFAIAGADGKFVHADARIDGATVVVSAAAVPQPTAARYCWANNPVASLFNQEGLPASPFRTDAPK